MRLWLRSLRSIIVLLGFATVLSVSGDCEFPSSPMQHDNGTLMYCNPDPDKFDGDAYYTRYTINCPERSTCQYIWAGLYVCCTPPERRVARKQGKLHRHDAEPISSNNRITTETSSSSVTMETTVAAAEFNGSDNRLFIGAVNSSVRPTISEASTAFASLSTEPFALVRAAGSTVLESKPPPPTTRRIKAAFFSTESPGSGSPPSSVAPLKNSTIRTTVATESLTVDHHHHRSSNNGSPSLMPSGYTGVLKWPTKKPLNAGDTTFEQHSITPSSINNNSLSNNRLVVEQNIDGLGNSKSVLNRLPDVRNRSITAIEESANKTAPVQRTVKFFDRRLSNSSVTSSEEEILDENKLKPDITVVPKNDLAKPLRLSSPEFKIVTIQCLLPNDRKDEDKSVAQDYDYLALLNDDDDIISSRRQRHRHRRRHRRNRDGGGASSFSDSLKNLINEIPLCPDGVSDGDDLGKNIV